MVAAALTYITYIAGRRAGVLSPCRVAAGSGRVIVFEALDPTNWNAPWMLLTRDGMPKAKFTRFFDSRYTVAPEGEIAGMKAWRLEPKAN